MCLKCFRETRPERGNTTMEHGSYLVNFKACAQCGNKTSISTTQEEIDKECDGSGDVVSETVTYNHVCAACEHHIAEHYYNYEVDELSQEYTMECMLCGKGGTSHKLKNFEEIFGGKASADVSTNDQTSTREPTGDIIVKEVSMDTTLVSAITKRALRNATATDDDSWDE